MKIISGVTTAVAFLARSLLVSVLLLNGAWANESPAPVLIIEQDGDNRVVTTTTPLGKSKNWYLTSSNQDYLPTPADADVDNSLPAPQEQEQELWLLNGGYRHSFSSQLSFFVEAGVAQLDDARASEGYNLTTGMRYAFAPKLALRSRISHITIEQNRASKLELQGLYQLTNSFDLRATYDLAPEQQALSLGLGFRF